MFIGSIWNIGPLQGIGGTFFFLYIIDKYFEIPAWKKHWAIATLGFGIMLYVSTLIMRAYPTYFFQSNLIIIQEPRNTRLFSICRQNQPLMI